MNIKKKITKSKNLSDQYNLLKEIWMLKNKAKLPFHPMKNNKST